MRTQTLELPVMEQPRRRSRSHSHGRRRRRRRKSLGTRLVNGMGWVFMLAGAIVLLYLVYSLLFTNLQTEAAQSDLREQWQQQLGQVEPAAAPDEVPLAASGDAVAMLEFARPGSAEPLVSADPLFVVHGVGVEDLKQGPGHYPDTAAPGAPGNFAVAGHRTTYAAPFFHLDQLVPGDEVYVTDRSGARFTYRVVAQQVVSPAEGSVLQPDPLGTGRPMLTLTTCHPRFSAAQRLIVFAELV